MEMRSFPFVLSVAPFLAVGVLALVMGSAGAPDAPLEVVADVPLPGGATRMDYISIDPAGHRAYLAHMGDGEVIAVDTRTREVAGIAKDAPRVRGVLAVPSLGRVYAAASGGGEVLDLDAATLKLKARIRAGNVDGLDYAPGVNRLFVTDQHGGNEVVIDPASDTVLKIIPVGDDVGKTRYDPATGQILVALGSTSELLTIDPRSLAITGRHPLPGIEGAHGVAVDPATATAFIAGEGNSAVCAFDLHANKVKGVAPVGRDVDVLDVDSARKRLVVAAESGVVSVFDLAGGGLRKISEAMLAPHAHVVGIDPATHLAYFPLQDVKGRPVLRIVRVP